MPQTSTPVPTVPVMAQVNHKLLRLPPEPFKGKADWALTFWNMLENYYNINAAIYTANNTKIAAALTVKAPSCLKVRLARFVLRQVLIERKSLRDIKAS